MWGAGGWKAEARSAGGPEPFREVQADYCMCRSDCAQNGGGQPAGAGADGGPSGWEGSGAGWRLSCTALRRRVRSGARVGPCLEESRRCSRPRERSPWAGGRPLPQGRGACGGRARPDSPGGGVRGRGGGRSVRPPPRPEALDLRRDLGRRPCARSVQRRALSAFGEGASGAKRAGDDPATLRCWGCLPRVAGRAERTSPQNGIRRGRTWRGWFPFLRGIVITKRQ